MFAHHLKIHPSERDSIKISKSIVTNNALGSVLIVLSNLAHVQYPTDCCFLLRRNRKSSLSSSCLCSQQRSRQQLFQSSTPNSVGAVLN